MTKMNTKTPAIETSTKRSDTELQVPSWDNSADEFDGCHDDEFVAAG